MVVQVVPVDTVRIIIRIIGNVAGFMQVIQNAVDHPPDGTGVLTDLFQQLGFAFFGGYIFGCHLKMTTEQKYLSLSVMENI
jgi:hypothetical protein